MPLLTFLEDRPLTKKANELTLEAIQALGKIGGRDAALFLTRYEHTRWWRSPKLQRELKEAALRSMEEIEERKHGGREKKG